MARLQQGVQEEVKSPLRTVYWRWRERRTCASQRTIECMRYLRSGYVVVDVEWCVEYVEVSVIAVLCSSLQGMCTISLETSCSFTTITTGLPHAAVVGAPLPQGREGAGGVGAGPPPQAADAPLSTLSQVRFRGERRESEFLNVLVVSLFPLANVITFSSSSFNFLF